MHQTLSLNVSLDDFCVRYLQLLLGTRTRGKSECPHVCPHVHLIFSSSRIPLAWRDTSSSAPRYSRQRFILDSLVHFLTTVSDTLFGSSPVHLQHGRLTSALRLAATASRTSKQTRSTWLAMVGIILTRTLDLANKTQGIPFPKTRHQNKHQNFQQGPSSSPYHRESSTARSWRNLSASASVRNWDRCSAASLPPDQRPQTPRTRVLYPQ